MLQILIWLLCVYLIFRAVHIFQTAFVQPPDNPNRGAGVLFGVCTVGAAVVVAWIFVSLAAAQVSSTSMASWQRMSEIVR